jgi:protein-S-isoprenylcysteine O-methyltransferase Ste14
VATHADARDTAGVPVPPPLIYVAGLLVGVALELVAPVDWPPTAAAVAVGVVGGALWLWLDGAATLSFRRAGTSPIPFKPTTALVAVGPYRFTRNPMYLGMACLYVALAFALGIVWALAVLPAVLAVVDRVVIAREEHYLAAKFGERYLDYKRRVRRWL